MRVMKGEGCGQGQVKGKQWSGWVSVRRKLDNSSDKTSKKMFFFDEYDNLGVDCDFGQ